MYMKFPPLVIPYDTAEYDFRTPVQNALCIQDLSKLHLDERLRDSTLRVREDDQGSEAHKRYYKRIGDTGFYDTYRRFVHSVVAPLIGEPIFYQTVPTFRVHQPGNKAVGEFHTDSMYGHQKAAMNFWVPLTESYGSNALYVSQTGDEADATPQQVSYGSLIIFDAVGTLHGNKINTTRDTRVSFDFRTIPRSQYVPSTETSVNTGVPLVVGSYYSEMD